MSEDVLKGIMLEVHNIECGVIDELSDFKPSLRHRFAMKKIFARFERNARNMKNKEITTEPPASEHRTSIRNIKQRVIMAILIIILAAMLAGCVNVVAKFISEHFNGNVYEDNTQLFAGDLESCPQTIEYQYFLTNVPDGFELIDTVSTSSYAFMYYKDQQTGRKITLKQWVKSHFAPHYNTENHTFEEIKINGTTVLYINFSTNTKNSSVLIWDNDDYIIEILADLDKNAVMYLLDITKL